MAAILPILSSSQAVTSLAQSGAFGESNLTVVATTALALCAAVLVALLVYQRRTLRRYRLAEETSRRNEDRFRALFDATPDCLFIKDRDRRYVQLNPAMQRLFGLPAKSLLGRTEEELFGREAGKRIRCSDERVFAGEIVKDEDVRPVLGREHVFDVVKVPLRDASGEVFGLCGIARDVTERSRGERTLRESEERYRLVSEATGDAVYDWNITADQSSRNPKYHKLFAPDAFSSYGWWAKAIHPDDRARVEQSLEKTFAGSDGYWSEEYRFRKEDGGHAHVWDRGFIIRDGEGKAVRMIGAMTDLTEHIRAREALQESEARFRALVEHLPAVTYMAPVNDPGAPTYLSPQIRRLLGHDPESIYSDPVLWRSLILPEDRERLERAWASRSELGRPCVNEYRMTVAGGRIVWCRDYSVLVQIGRGPAFRQGVILDVTAEKAAEAALTESEERYRTTFEQAAVGIANVGSDGRFLRANRKLCDILGYGREELLKLRFQDITHADDVDRDVAQMNVLLSGSNDTYTMEKRYVRRDGSIMWAKLTCALVRMPRGASPRFVSIVEDITERKRAEAARRESEAKFRTLAETLSAGMFIFQGTRIKYANPAAEKITGYKRAELCEQEFWMNAHPDFRELIRQRGLARQRGEAVPTRYEAPIITKDGQTRWLDLSAAMLVYEGKPAVLVTALDITDRKAAEEKMWRHQAQLAHVDRLKTLGELAAGLAHELNQPLSAITNYVSGSLRRIQTGSLDTPMLVEVLKAVGEQGRRAAEIIRRVRRFVRPEPVKWEIDDLNRIVREAVSFFDPIATRTKVAVQVDLEASELPVGADAIQIEQVVLNLLLNSAEAIGDNDGDRCIHLRTRVLDQEAIVSVSDTGCGVSQATAERIFDPFYTTKGRGMGIGLSISRSIIEDHGGRLWMEAAQTAGVTFLFSLPIAEGALAHEDRADGIRSGR